MRRGSLKLRLTLWYTLLMLVVSTIALTVVTSLTQNMMNRDSQERILRAVNTMTMEMSGRPVRGEGEGRRNGEPPPEGGKMENPPRRNLSPKFYDNGVHMVLLDENQAVVGGQIPFSITDPLDFEEGALRRMSYDGNQYLVYDRSVSLQDGKTAYLKGFISIDENKTMLRSALRNNLIVTGILILIAALGGYWIVWRALKPVERMSGTAQEIIQSKDLSRRINIGKGKDELAALANTFDKMLSAIQEAFERERQFTSDASHELRTPIAVILSECEYMTSCADTAEELRSSAESVQEEAQRMNKLVSQLLTICRMDRETLQLNLEETELSELVDFICTEQAEIHGDSGVELTRDIAPAITAEADRFLLARLYINLISNAYQYNREGGRIQVSLREEGGQVIFAVRDTGIGIKPENLTKIWERFFQEDPARTSNGQGSAGLGLAMVKWIAEKHGGSISVESEPGKGSAFTFTMPKSQNPSL